LRVDAELRQIAPNLTLLYDPQVSGDGILAMAATNIAACCKPHIANHAVHADAFDERGYGIVSCYNVLPLGGGASTLARVNLKEVARRASSEAHFFDDVLPRYLELNFRLMQARIDYLFGESGFFDSFLVKEGWIDKDRFTAMFGVFAMAEAVDLLQEKEGREGRYGFDDTANALGHRISATLADTVRNRSLDRVWRGHALLHSQAGLSDDREATPGVRIPYGTEPDPVTHVKALAPHHQYYEAGISEILTVDESISNNPEALVQLCEGAFASGFREFTVNVANNDLGAEAAELTGILDRRPRVVGNELHPGYGQ
jgi:YjjI family glycine radical enzyme